MLLRRLLKSLGCDDDADIEENSYARFERDQFEDPLYRSSETDEGDENTVQRRIAGAGAEALPTGMADVDRRRKRAAEQRRGDRADAVRHQRRKGFVAVPRRLGALDILQRADDIEDAHGKDHGHVFEEVVTRERLPQRAAGKD